jgi:hypothetical protein
VNGVVRAGKIPFHSNIQFLVSLKVADSYGSRIFLDMLILYSTKTIIMFKLTANISRLSTLIFWAIIASSLFANAQSKKDEPFTIENYYKVKWGYADEFINLWKTNHYPLLKKAQEKGDIISVVAEKPILHSGEDTRWDFKVTIVFKNAILAFDPNLTTPYKQQLYTDQDKLTRDEQHRFELLLAHWDVMVENVELK